MTYLAFHFVFTIPPILVLAVVQARRRGGIPSGRAWAFLLLVALIALALAALTGAVVLHRHFAAAAPDMGSVSERWLAEYRASHPS